MKKMFENFDVRFKYDEEDKNRISQIVVDKYETTLMETVEYSNKKSDPKDEYVVF